jgi:hypothetical protein
MMGFFKFVLGTIGSIVALAIAVKLLAILLTVVGIVLKLVWLAVIVGFFLLVAWLVYRIFFPQGARAT